MSKKFNPFLFSKCTKKNIIMNNILWGLLVVLNFGLLILVSKSFSTSSDVPSIKTLPVILIMGPLLWALSIVWIMTIKLFDEFKYNMLSTTLMAILAIPLYLFFGIINFVITVILLFIRYKVTEAKHEEEKKKQLIRDNKKTVKKKRR